MTFGPVRSRAGVRQRKGLAPAPALARCPSWRTLPRRTTEANEQRGLGTARKAPGRPEIEKDRSPSEAMQAPRAACEYGQGEVWRGLSRCAQRGLRCRLRYRCPRGVRVKGEARTRSPPPTLPRHHPMSGQHRRRDVQGELMMCTACLGPDVYRAVRAKSWRSLARSRGSKFPSRKARIRSCGSMM